MHSKCHAVYTPYNMVTRDAVSVVAMPHLCSNDSERLLMFPCTKNFIYHCRHILNHLELSIWSQVSSDESERLIKMEEVLHKRVIGQEEAVVAIARAIRRARVGLKNPNRPIASFIFSGPTGARMSWLRENSWTYVHHGCLNHC